METPKSPGPTTKLISEGVLWTALNRSLDRNGKMSNHGFFASWLTGGVVEYTRPLEKQRFTGYLLLPADGSREPRLVM